MYTQYWIYPWTKFRKAEVVRVPAEYDIHPDFLQGFDESEIRSTFAELNRLYLEIFDGIMEVPDEFGMPLYEIEKYRWFSTEWRDSGTAPFRPFILLYNLLISGEMNNDELHVSIDKYGNIKSAPRNLNGSTMKVRQAHFLFERLTDYGFVFEGLKNNKTTNENIIITYPDNVILLRLMKRLADKANNIGRLFDFLRCTFRLLADDIHTINYECVEETADNLHTEWEKDFVYQMDNVLTSTGLFRKLYGGYEGPGIGYYRSEKVMNSAGPTSFHVHSRDAQIQNLSEENLTLSLRIRNVPNCLTYLESCPDSVKRIFTDYNDEGCGRNLDGSCKHGISYEINKTNYWRCACCGSGFRFKPCLEDIEHYLKLVELGEKKK